MVFGPWIETWEWVTAFRFKLPFKKRRLDFITIHYLYIMGLASLASILMFPAGGPPGGLRYIDALFLASGAATQSGLNTVDINLLNTYQQVVLYMSGMIANPIFINTIVVFVRLYWFEKRFQRIVHDARNFRRTRSRSRTATQPGHDNDIGREERGVNGRSIVVLHGAGKSLGPAAGARFHERSPKVFPPGSSASSSEINHERDKIDERSKQSASDGDAIPDPPLFHRNITFADEVDSTKPFLSPGDRIPHQMNFSQHTAILDNQRNPKDKHALRIPGPREFDEGRGPETLDHEASSSCQPTSPIDSNGKPHPDGTDSQNPGSIDPEKDSVKPDVTTDGSNRDHLPRHHSFISRLTFRKSATGHSRTFTSVDRSPSTAPLRPRSNSVRRRLSHEGNDPMPYFSWQPTIGRNSAFVDLTEEQREELGGIEYRSLKALAVILVSYYLCFHFLGVITFLPWIVQTDRWGSVVDDAGQHRAWWGIFTPATLFNDVGFTLTPDSMISFQQAVLPLLLGSLLIVAGNTGFPCFLRFIIWLIHCILPHTSPLWEELKFLLDHPRRCFTLLFPGLATWWLFWVLVFFNGLDLIFFIVLDLNDPVVTSIPPGYRVVSGLFQAVSTRTSGTAVVNLALLHPGIQVSYLIMMYISVFPIAISVRRTNVYEEKSLGIYSSQGEEDEDSSEPSYVGAHLRRQLSFDLWFIFLGLFIIAIAEGPRIQDNNDVAFSMFACLFEIVSAYGTVGLSLGYTNINASFSAEFTTVSKLVIICMQIRGRHRGLPYELDRAILLPSENLHKKEDQDASRRLTRRGSMVSATPGSAGVLMSPAGGVGTSAGTGVGAGVGMDTAATTTGRELEEERAKDESGVLDRRLGYER